MTKKDKKIRDLREEVKRLKAEVELSKMLHACKPIYTEPVKRQISRTCSNCGGTGQMRQFYPVDGGTGGYIVTCPICCGSGWVVVECVDYGFPYN